MNSEKELYKPFKSKAKGKKMSVYVMRDGKKKLINFGNTDYEDFTQHRDRERRKLYLARSGKIRNKEGKLTKDDKNYSNYWARTLLWSA